MNLTDGGGGLLTHFLLGASGMDGMKNASKKDVAVRALGTTPCLVVLQSYRNTSRGFYSFSPPPILSVFVELQIKGRAYQIETLTQSLSRALDRQRADAGLAVDFSSSSAPHFSLERNVSQTPHWLVLIIHLSMPQTLRIAIRVKFK